MHYTKISDLNDKHWNCSVIMVVATLREDIFYSVVLVRERHFFLAKEKKIWVLVLFLDTETQN